jgi:hypothetical protein
VCADAQLAASVPRQLFDLGFDSADGRQDIIGGINDQPTGGGRQHPAPGANEDGRAELVFNLTQLMTDGGLGDVESIGGARDTFCAGDLHDQAKVAGFKESAHEGSLFSCQT